MALWVGGKLKKGDYPMEEVLREVLGSGSLIGVAVLLIGVGALLAGLGRLFQGIDHLVQAQQRMRERKEKNSSAS